MTGAQVATQRPIVKRWVFPNPGGLEIVVYDTQRARAESRAQAHWGLALPPVCDERGYVGVGGALVLPDEKVVVVDDRKAPGA